MKKSYLCMSIAILVIGCSLGAAMAAGANQGQASGSPTGNTVSSGALSAQAFRHREWVWVPGVAAQVNSDAVSKLLSSGVYRNSIYLDLNADAEGVAVSVPVQLGGAKRNVRKITLCTYEEGSFVRVDKVEIHNGSAQVASAPGTGKSFYDYQENTFDFGRYYPIDRGLTVVLYLNNTDTLHARNIFIPSVGVETRW